MIRRPPHSKRTDTLFPYTTLFRSFYTSYKKSLKFLNAQNVGLPFTTPDQPTNGSVAANIADLEIWGIELETSVSPVRDVTVSVNGAYTHEKVKSLGQVSFGPGVPPPVATKAQVNLPTPTFAGTASLRSEEHTSELQSLMR